MDDLAGAVEGLTKGVGAHFGFQVTGVPAAFSNIFKLLRHLATLISGRALRFAPVT